MRILAKPGLAIHVWVLLTASWAQARPQQTLRTATACGDESEGELQKQAAALTSSLSLEGKIGQMIQADYLDIAKAMAAGQHPVRDLALGSLLSGGSSIVADNSVAGWHETLAALQQEAMSSSSQQPLLLGVDAVHGHGILHGATVFPHNVALGATRNPALLGQIAAATASEVLETGFNWAFAPAVAVVQDIRWGRSYESYGENPELQALLTPAFVVGLRKTPGPRRLIGTAKHFIGDGGTTWGTGYPEPTSQSPQIDRGDTRLSIDELIALHGQGYQRAVDAGIDTVMASYNSVNGARMHGNGSLINGYLKAAREQDGLGFRGMVISDWNAIDELPTPPYANELDIYRAQIVQAVLAGVDMIMVAEKLQIGGASDTQFRFERVHKLLLEAVRSGDISSMRIDDAVQRIMRTKLRAGLYCPAPQLASTVGSPAHRQLARSAVSQSLVLLKNAEATLPITPERYRTLCVAGAKADDYGAQVGGWTVGWQGQLGNAERVAGSQTLLDGLQAAAVATGIRLVYAANGVFSDADCLTASDALTLTVAGEGPYAEYKGDRADLHLDTADAQMLSAAQQNLGRQVLLLIAGRPLIITDELPRLQALVMAWLPGSQGEGVADVLFGTARFSGKLPVTWPLDMAHVDRKSDEADDGVLYPYGFGLRYAF